jgi:VanZ family protein
MGIVLAASSSSLSSERTGGILNPILAWLAPWLRLEHADLIHWLVRKAAHLTEYGLLAVLWRRALVRGASVTVPAAGWAALAIAVACAVIDESHQARVPTRSGAPADVALDTFGAAMALVFAQVGWWRVVEAATGVLLWIAVIGGVGALALGLAAGGSVGALWFSVPAAAALLLYRWRRSTSRS